MPIDYKEKALSERQIVPGYLEQDLKSGRFIEVWAINMVTEERVQLVLNSQGQLCVKKGPSKLLFDRVGKDLILDSIEVKELRDEVATAVEKTVPTHADHKSWAYWAGKVSDLPKDYYANKIPELVIAEPKIPEVTVHCALPYPKKGATIGLEIEDYLDTLYAYARAQAKQMGGKFNGIIKVETNIRNYPKMLHRFKHALEDAQLIYTITGDQPGFAMAKLVVSFEEEDL